MDYYSRFPEVRQLIRWDSEAVINVCKEVFACHGIPEVYVSDNGPQYNSARFKAFAKEYGFQHVTSSPQYPRGNGLAERTVQTLKGLMDKAKESNEDFALALLAYRASPHDSTGISPAQLLMGRRVRTRLPASPELLKPRV